MKKIIQIHKRSQIQKGKGTPQQTGFIGFLETPKDIFIKISYRSKFHHNPTIRNLIIRASLAPRS